MMNDDLGFLRWKEDDQWLLGHKKYYVLVQGKSLESCFEKWCRMVAVELVTSGDNRIPRTPEDVLDAWQSKHDAHKGN